MHERFLFVMRGVLQKKSMMRMIFFFKMYSQFSFKAKYFYKKIKKGDKILQKKII